MKILKTLGFIILSLVLLTFCDNSTDPNVEEVQVEVSQEYVADQLGDKNGVTSTEELNYIEEYFNSNDEMWLITTCMNSEGETVKSDYVKDHFSTNGKSYLSAENLRSENEGLSIKTPWIGITVLEKNNSMFITKTYRSPGPKFSEAEWVKIKIIK